MGKFSAEAVKRAQELRTGLPLASLCAAAPRVDEGNRSTGPAIGAARSSGVSPRACDDKDQVVIEPQVPDYWPQTPKLGDADTIVLSRFAYLRRRGNEMVLESPRAGALFKLCDPEIAAALAMLSTPQKISRFRRQERLSGA